MYYICPMAEKHRTQNFLLCRAMMKEGENYDRTLDAMKVFCTFQKYCGCTKGAVNLPEAKNCKLRLEILNQSEEESGAFSTLI